MTALNINEISSSLMSLSGGVYLDVLNPDPSVITMDDIAHRLSNQCRWAGASNRHYSVAEHSVNVSNLVTPMFALQALLHDMTEAYLVDLPTPIKRLFPDYYTIEDNLWNVMADKFKVPRGLDMTVKEADKRIAKSEKAYLIGPGDTLYNGNFPPLTIEQVEDKTTLWRKDITPEIAEYMFVARYNKLTNNAK